MRGVIAGLAFAVAVTTPILVVLLFLQNQDAIITWING